jgi:hypothetical protein
MIEAGTSKPAPYDVVIVHSFSESGSTAAAIVANTSAPWLSGWRWPKRKCGLGDQRAICSEHSPPPRA